MLCHIKPVVSKLPVNRLNKMMVFQTARSPRLRSFTKLAILAPLQDGCMFLVVVSLIFRIVKIQIKLARTGI